MKQRNSIKGKILIMSILVLLMSNVAIGALGFFISREQLNIQGRRVLQNGVETALQIIDLAQDGVEKGIYTLPEAQEIVRTKLLGKLKEDGKRSMKPPIDIGEYGYFLLYEDTESIDANSAPTPRTEKDNKNVNMEDETVIIKKTIDTAKNGGGFINYKWHMPNSEEIGKKIVYSKLDPNWNWIITAGTYRRDFNSGSMYILKVSILWLVISFFLMAIIMYRFANRMGKDLNMVTSRAENIANLDVSEDISKDLLDRKDEIGMLANSFQQIINNFRSFISQVLDASNHVAASAAELSASTEQSAISANEVAKAIEDIAQGATQQAMDNEVGARNIDELANLVENNEDFIVELNAATADIDKLKDEGFEILEELVRNTKASNQGAENVQEVINSTNQSVKRIANASNMIRSIAEQTNLLALNAAIEAARAGESGRGFAVVAEEIRKLAEESSGFTEDITKVVDDLIKKTENTVHTMDEVVEIIRLQNHSVEETNEKFMGIAGAIEKTDEIIKLINGSGKEMLERKDHIIEIIENLSAISQENAAGTEEASAAVEEQTASIQEIANSSLVLEELAENIQETISKFKY